MTREEKKKIILRAGISVLVILAIVGIGYLVLRAFGLTELDREDIQQMVEDTGALAPIVFIVISFLQVTFVPIPSTVTVLAGSYIFGAVESFFYSYVGIFFGALVAFELGRGVGRPFAAWVAGGGDTLDSWVARLKGREHALLWIMFFCPFFPDDLLCTIAGMFKISHPEFIAMQLVTRTTSIAGTLLIMSGELIPYEGWGLVLLGVIGVVFIAASVLSLIYYERLTAFIHRLADRLTRRAKNQDEADDTQ